MNKAIDSSRNIQGSLTVSQVISYLNGWEGAPSAQEVFDHYWAVLEYALSDDEKERIRRASLEGGIELLYALGGEVWNAFPEIDLMRPYEYWEKDVKVEGAVGAFTFSLPKRPIDNLRAGLALGRNMSFCVIDQHCKYDYTFERSVHVFRDGELADILNVNLEYHSIRTPFDDRAAELGISQDVVDAEVEWARRRDFKWVIQKNGKLRFTDYFHDVEVLKQLYSVEKILSIETWGCLGTYDEALRGTELDGHISKIVDDSLLGYLIRNWGEREVGDYLQTLDYPFVSQYHTLPPSKEDFPSGPIGSEMLKEIPDAEDLIRMLPAKEAAVQLKILSNANIRVKRPVPSWRLAPDPPFEFGKSMLELPFPYSEAELALQGVWDGVRFELPETPKELLLLGARTGSRVSAYAWRIWVSPSRAPVLLFDDVRDEYLGNVAYLPDSMVLLWDITDEYINRRARLGGEPNIIEVILRWSLEVGDGIRG